MAEEKKKRSSSIDRMATAYLSPASYPVVTGASKDGNVSISKIINKAVKAWIESLSEDERRKYILLNK